MLTVVSGRCVSLAFSSPPASGSRLEYKGPPRDHDRFARACILQIRTQLNHLNGVSKMQLKVHRRTFKAQHQWGQSERVRWTQQMEIISTTFGYFIPLLPCEKHHSNPSNCAKDIYKRRDISSLWNTHQVNNKSQTVPRTRPIISFTFTIPAN